MATTHALVWRDPKQLKKHPLNLKLYGDARDDKLGEALKHGIDTPLLITPDDVTISGHQRRQWAIILKMKEVPCIVRYDLTDPLSQEEALIRCNEQRERTLEQKAREFERLKEIEAERAEARQKANLKKGDAPVMETVPQRGKQGESSKNGVAADIAAEAVGLSRPTAEAAVEAVHEIDAAEAAGDTETAADIRETLNKRGAKPAAAKAKESKARREPQTADAVRRNGKSTVVKPKIDRKEMERAFAVLGQALNKQARACGVLVGEHGKTIGPAAESYKWALDAIKEARAAWEKFTTACKKAGE